MNKRRLYILHKLPTPYNDDLFRALHADPEIQLQVFHLWKGSARRPWKSKMGTGYPNYYMRPKFGIDWYSLRLACTDRNSLLMVGDWAHLPTVTLLLVRIVRGLPVAVWTDTPQEHLKRPFWKRIPRSAFLRWLLPRMDIIFGSGLPARRVLISMGTPAEKIIDFQFVVDLERPENVSKNVVIRQRAQELRQSVGCKTENVVFGMSGTIDLEKKAQDIGLRAFAECCQAAARPIGLLIAGDGPDLPKLQALANKLGVADSVNFLGWQEPEQMDSFYLTIDVLFHPANYDPFPLVVIEAMNYSKPVIGSVTCGAVEEKIHDSITGFAVSPGDVNAMFTAMMRFVEDPLLMRSTGLACRQTAETWPISRAVNVIKQQLFLRTNT